MTTAEPVTATVYIDAPPERVFEHITRPEAIVTWMGEHARLELEPGGRFEVDIEDVSVRGRVLDIDPPHRLVVSWGYAGSASLPPGTSTVEIRLTAIGAGTRVDLEHRDLPAPQLRAHVIGWMHYLDRLQRAATGHNPGPDPGMPAVSAEPAEQHNPRNG